MTLPTHYTDLIRSLRDHYDAEEKKATDAVNTQLESIRYRRKQNTDKITNFTATFMETGVFVLDWPHETYEKPNRGYNEHYGTTLNKYAQALAHSLRRPFVRLYGESLIVPKTKKLSVLTTPLMFVAKKYDYPYKVDSYGVIELTHFTSLYKYWFRGSEGQEWRTRWLEYIKEPECRAALGLLAR